MALQDLRRWFPQLAAAVLLVVAFAVLWTVAPEDLRGLVLLGGAALTATTYVAIYVVERSRHW
jgi:hypothetical protein